MLQYEVKADTHASLVIGWLLTIGGIIGVVLPVLPGWLFLLLGLSTLSKRYGWARGLRRGCILIFRRSRDTSKD